jgi:hypothetical protein
MIQKLKEYGWMFLIVLVVLGVAFYWYEWRPSEIRKECVSVATQCAKRVMKDKSELAPESYTKEQVERGFYMIRDYDKCYNDCLSEQGLEK